ncbi:HAD-like domain-containing protein [Auriculariales sp. MPI-PUGE-AT-0066]|nr:HAD-like domain-containing protein [Auriculariales sp. MPI-PUGE-AT-0066]
MTSTRKYRALLLDLSGTLHVGTSALPRAVESVSRLRAAGVPFRVCSNTSKDGTRALRRKLEDMGFDFAEHEVFTSIQAVRAELQARSIKHPLLLLSDSALEDFTSYDAGTTHPPSTYDAVVVGLAPALMNYDALNTAFRVLMSHKDRVPPADVNATNWSGDEPVFIATHRSRYIRTQDNALSLGPGAFIAGLEASSGVQATVVGKPSREFFELALRSLSSEGVKQEDWSRCAIVGDDVESDLGGGAKEIGLGRVLVKSGKYLAGDETRAGGEVDLYDSFARLVDELLGPT